MKTLSIIVLITATFLLFQKSRTPTVSTITGDAMGTTWSLRCEDAEQYRPLVYRILSEQENILSHWRANSEISRLNAGQITEVSTELKRAINLAEHFKAETRGAFDHTLLRQTQAAGFAPLLATEKHNYDLSAMAKGYCIDLLTATLREHGLINFVIELGGECYASGTQDDGTPWPVLIPSPTGGEGVTVYLSNQAIATSGNYQQVAKIENKLISSHLIAPNTGKPHLAKPSSVSIIANDCATADAYATALFINPKLVLPENTKAITLPETKP
ncbi:FAD:protein FMN transferase [Oceaniferula spumae]|uniref:FAD:protein FMN transferase n=1 Tax=Oceaniferula spumae TaxID=2979115 RepID=A0AAT9FS07_9BACT